MKKKNTEEHTVKTSEAEKKDWEKVYQEAFEAGCITKSLWLAMNSSTNVELEDVEIDTLARMVEAKMAEIQTIAGNHLP